MMKNDETWVNKKWRPAMAWMYMVICIFDFIVFPMLFIFAQMWGKGAANITQIEQWQPLTLIGAGLFHMAMGAVLGITAWSRGKEKITNVERTPPTRHTRYNEHNDYENDDGQQDRADYRDRLASNAARENRP